jgi:hypothetical protein
LACGIDVTPEDLAQFLAQREDETLMRRAHEFFFALLQTK